MQAAPGLVLRKNGRDWERVQPSLVLYAIGVEGKGVVALVPFGTGTRIGAYSGTPVGWYPTRAAAIAACRRLDCNSGMLVLVQCAHQACTGLGRAGFAVLDGSTGGPPFLQFVNDARGTGKRANCRITANGNVVTTRRVATGQELLAAYGSA